VIGTTKALNNDTMLFHANIFHCDEFLGSGNCVTYCNHSLKQSSFLDHMFVSDSIRQDIVYAEEYDRS